MNSESTIIKDGRNSLIIPTQYGDLCELYLRLYETPVSIQGDSKKKRNLKNKIKALTSQYNQIIAGDIQIEITWYTSEQQRYEYSSCSDLDNIIKILLDGLSGPDGLYVDDCLVQHFSVTWIDTGQDEHVEIIIQYDILNRFPKSDCVFIHLGKSLCQPILMDTPIAIIDYIIESFEKRSKIIEEIVDNNEAIGTGTIQRIFHRNKLKEFKVFDYDELINFIKVNRSNQ